jgi:Putative zinc-finger
MSEVFRCDDKETLVAYLYGEIDAEVRREVDRHLRTCAACTRETEGLQAVRQDLQSWLPPEPEFAYSIAQRAPAPMPSATVLPSPRWSSLRAVPAWASVAAAALFIGVAASIANIQVRSTADGYILTTGWMQAPTPPQTAAVPASTRDNDEWRRELAALEQSLRGDMAAQRAAAINAAATARADGNALDMTSNAAILRRVREMITASEERQRQEVAQKFVLADHAWNARRQTDLVKIDGSFRSLQNRTLTVQANQQEMIKEVNNHLRRVNYSQPNQ